MAFLSRILCVYSILHQVTVSNRTSGPERENLLINHYRLNA
jgi:hypothetical protein